MGSMKIMIGFRVTPEFKKFLENLADEENRNLSSFIENAILTYVKNNRGIDYKKQIRDKSKNNQ
jgi:predicted transcriptional regulator